jgi:hypothetical protein
MSGNAAQPSAQAIASGQLQSWLNSLATICDIMVKSGYYLARQNTNARNRAPMSAGDNAQKKLHFFNRREDLKHANQYLWFVPFLCNLSLL